MISQQNRSDMNSTPAGPSGLPINGHENATDKEKATGPENVVKDRTRRYKITFGITVILTNIKLNRTGMNGMPSGLASIRQEMGLLNPEYTDYGDTWVAFTKAWGVAETLLHKSGKPNLTANELKQSGIPLDLQKWALAKLNKEEAGIPTTKDYDMGPMNEYILSISTGTRSIDGDTLLNKQWCRSGPTGIRLLVVGMYWWRLLAGHSALWEERIKDVQALFSIVSGAKSL